MKLRQNFNHEFCVTNALRLGADCLHKVTYFGFIRFLSENSLHSKFSIAVYSQPFEIFVPFSAVHNKPFKVIL